MARKTTQSVVALNAKIESVNILTIEWDGASAFLEGAPITLDGTTGKAAVPANGADDVCFVNFVDSARTDTQFTQKDPFDPTAPTASIQSGGLAGLQGVEDIGLPAASWSGGALPTVGQIVQVAGGAFTAVNPTAADRHYGMIYRIKEGRAFFQFHSVPISY